MREAELADGSRIVVGSAAALTSFLERHPDAPGYELEYATPTSNPTLLVDIEPVESTLERPAAAPAVACTPVDGRRDSFTVRVDAIDTVAPVDPPEEPFVAGAATIAHEARGYRRLAERSPDAIDVADLLSLLERATDEGADRATTLEALRALAAERPGHCAPAVPVLRDVLEAGDAEEATVALAVLREIGEETPEEIAPAFAEIRPYLDSRDADARFEATRCVAAIGEAYSDDVRPATEQLASIVDRGERGRRYAVWGLRHVSTEDPGALEPFASVLVAAATDTSPSDSVRTNATATLGRTVQASPSIGVEFVDEIASLLDDENHRLRNNGVGLLGDVAKLHTDAVHPYVDDLAPLLTVDDRYTRINASCTLSRIADDFPSSVEPLADEFVELLDDDDAIVRKNACWALGHLRADTAASALRRLAGNDEEPDVRTRATWALSKIED